MHTAKKGVCVCVSVSLGMLSNSIIYMMSKSSRRSLYFRICRLIFEVSTQVTKSSNFLRHMNNISTIQYRG